MELSAIYHYVSRDFIYKVGENKYLFKVIAKKDDVKEVNFYFKEKYSFKIPFIKPHFNKERMKKVAFDYAKDFYEVIVEMDYICVEYYFEFIFKSGEVRYLSNHRMYEDKNFFHGYYDCSQYVLDTQHFEVPEWSKEAIVYQIFPDRFASSKMSLEKWENLPEVSRDLLGGDLKGITSKISYLKDLGINTIYLCPIFESESYHKYSTTDYLKIDPSFGTNEDFKELVKVAHQNGIRVIIDLVYNHSGTFFFAFEDVLKNQENSRYKDWYLINKFPVSKIGLDKNYKTFGYHKYMPKLNINNPEVKEYLFKVTKYWYDFAKVDGYRLDVGDEISHAFWQEFRTFVKNLNKDILIVGERWKESNSFLYNEWDTHMNYVYKFSIDQYFSKYPGTAENFINNINTIRGLYCKNCYYSLWNLIDSHDSPRFLYKVDNNEKLFRNAVILQFLLDGVPYIYYGDEIGMTTNSTSDTSSRQPMKWSKSLQNLNILEFYKKIIRIRKEFINKYRGEKEYLLIDNDSNTFIYKQFDKDEKDHMIVIYNHGDKDIEFKLKEKYADVLTNETYFDKIEKERIYILKRI